VQIPFEQYPVAQSAWTTQPRPSAHPLHDAPQSTSVSPPFLAPSVHVACWHLPPVHTAVSQSVVCAQPSPGVQAGQAVPPQSASVSLPFFTVSAQEGA
jgi:hypothetical protein